MYRVRVQEMGVERSFDLAPRAKRFVIGRAADCDIVLGSREASRHHASIIVLESGGGIVQDLSSENGTWVDGVEVQHIARRGSFEVVIGRASINFEWVSGP